MPLRCARGFDSGSGVGFDVRLHVLQQSGRRAILPGDGGWLFDDELEDWPLVNAESISVSAVDNALWSLELIVPADTSDCSSCCSL